MSALSAEIKKELKAGREVFYQGMEVLAVATKDKQDFVLVKNCSRELRIVSPAEIRFGEGMDAKRGSDLYTMRYNKRKECWMVGNVELR